MALTVVSWFDLDLDLDVEEEVEVVGALSRGAALKLGLSLGGGGGESEIREEEEEDELALGTAGLLEEGRDFRRGNACALEVLDEPKEVGTGAEGKAPVDATTVVFADRAGPALFLPSFLLSQAASISSGLCSNEQNGLCPFLPDSDSSGLPQPHHTIPYSSASRSVHLSP